MENLKALVYGKELNNYQKKLAIQEFEILQNSVKHFDNEMIKFGKYVARNYKTANMDDSDIDILMPRIYDAFNKERS